MEKELNQKKQEAWEETNKDPSTDDWDLGQPYCHKDDEECESCQ